MGTCPFMDNMKLFDKFSQLSKRGLLEIPNPEPKYQIVQFPKDFVRVEDTERAFGKEGLIAVSSGEWGLTFEKQIGRTSCGLASALGYTRQRTISNQEV